MSLIKKYLQKLGIGIRQETLTPFDAEALRTAFQTRYHNFKLLLGANNKALQIMSELEEARKGDTPFGMSFIRANCTAVSVNVFRMVQCMDQLAPRKYIDLYHSFRSIQGSIADILSEKNETSDGPLIISLLDLDKTRSDEAGNKMANLGEISNRLGIKVPNGFVISSRAFREFIGAGDLQAEIDRLMQSSAAEEIDQLYELSAQIQQLITRTGMPAGLETAILNAYSELERQEGQGIKVSLRSSALGEDSAQVSFAGLYLSELNVSTDNLIHAYKEIVASKYSLQAITYRLNRGIRDEDVDMCVGCMSMINAVAGGVIYSKNPLEVRDERIFIHSVFGLPKSVVDGSVAADLFEVSRNHPPRIVTKHIAEKRQKFVCYPDEGVCRLEIVGDEGAGASIADDTALELARIALRIEDHYGVAQDIEWALDDKGEIIMLQCRPLRQRNTIAEPRQDGCSIPACDVIVSGGLTASPGAGFGPVFVVRKEGEALLFPRGAVLVVKQALPRWAALLGRASALVAEQGTEAGHLANVAREFGVPAILGLEGATDLLKNAQPVTVDADGLRVCKGKIEPLLQGKETCKGLMDDSPVLDILKRVSEKIIPLRLLDPDASDFKPSQCRSFHDISRFCHEKSVLEMFSFGKDHHFSERASKQLVCRRVPMQWWVLNLDDGFREDVPGKFVDLDNIVSIPMLALWEGIVAVPWQGPPPVDSKGFMSILMEASSNPALDPSMPSPYSNRNYFMISKNYCSLSSRFGFHFSSIEAIVGERADENYIGFTFKGGAADHGRRVRRARFVGDILEDFEFSSDIRDDGVTARLEGYDEEVMKEKLNILGYLIMHTRQIDMIMFDDASCLQLKSKMLADISSVILSKSSSRAALN
ncbi:MAG: PEP/pyruvate-binding domain-containing protein [Syntrophobacteraceae bacterium]|jgi:pyruvate,water dikinase